MLQTEPPEWLARRTSRLLGSSISAATKVNQGYTPAERWLFVLEDGQRVFAKSGRDTPESAVATWLRTEYRAYTSLQAPFMPELVAWEDDDFEPILILEDLADARWPPPWRARDIDILVRTLSTISTTPLPEWVPSIEEREREHLSGWRRVQQDPAPFLSLGFCTSAWLENTLPTLLEASNAAPLDGDALVHFDIRSDNVCFVSGRALVVDWNWCGRGNRELDKLLWLPSLHAEGGPPPWELVNDSRGVSALLAGFLASRAGLAREGLAEERRRLQLTLLRTALPWALRELGLAMPALGGRPQTC